MRNHRRDIGLHAFCQVFGEIHVAGVKCPDAGVVLLLLLLLLLLLFDAGGSSCSILADYCNDKVDDRKEYTPAAHIEQMRQNAKF
jgi:hypothetical protein